MVPLLRVVFAFGLPLCLAGVVAAVVAETGADDPKADGDKSLVLGKRFGDSAYAVEELIAELGSAYTMASLELELTPRADHAAYIRREQ